MTWSNDMTARLRELAAPRDKSAAAMAEALSSEFGMAITRGMVFGKADREGIALRSQVEAEKSKPRRAKASAQRPKATAYEDRSQVMRARRARSTRTASPALSPIDPPFLPPVPLVKEYVPTGANAVSFLECREFVCKAFLPGEPVTAAGLVCGNPVVIGAAYRFCPACSESLTVHAKAPTPSTFVMHGKRRAAA